MRLRRLKLALTVVLAVSAGLALFFQFHFPTPQLEPEPHLGIGQALASRVLQLSPPPGRVALMAPAASENKFPGAALQLKAFHEALQRAGRPVALTNVVKLDPNRILRAPPGDFAELLRKLNDHDVVVSLLGPPVLTPEQKARVGAKRPRVLAVCIGDMPRQLAMKGLFTEKFLEAAIVSRRNPGLRPPSSGDPGEWFAHFYTWVTAAEAGDLPDAGGK